MPSGKRKRIDPHFVNDTCKKLFINQTHKDVVPQTWYKFDTLETSGFSLVCDLLRAQGWYFLCSEEFGKLADGFDVHLVRQFYANLEVADDDNRKMETIVNTKKIRFTPYDLTLFLASLNDEEGNLSIDNCGVKLAYSDNSGTIEGFNPLPDTKDLFDPAFQNLSKLNASHLKVHNRLLLHIIYSCILPRKGSLTYLSNIVLVMLHLINSRKKINLAILISSHMLSIHHSPSQILAHATLITFWLRAHWKIKPKNTLNKTYLVYDNMSLKRMFVHNLETDIWSIKSVSLANNDREENVVKTPDHTTSEDRPIPEPSVATPSMPTPSDPSMDSPSNPSSSSKASSSSMPCQQYTPTAPAYSPFTSIPPSTAPSSSGPSPADPHPLLTFGVNDILSKLETLQLQTPSVNLFNSACEQLINMNRSHQTLSSATFRRIEDKVDKFEDQLKGYGHHNLDCLRTMHSDQQQMNDLLNLVYKNQIELHNKFMITFQEDPATAPYSHLRKKNGKDPMR